MPSPRTELGSFGSHDLVSPIVRYFSRPSPAPLPTYTFSPAPVAPSSCVPYTGHGLSFATAMQIAPP